MPPNCFTCDKYRACQTCQEAKCTVVGAVSYPKSYFSGCCIMANTGIVHPSQSGCTQHVSRVMPAVGPVQPTCGDCDHFAISNGGRTTSCYLRPGATQSTNPPCGQFILARSIPGQVTPSPNIGTITNCCVTCTNFDSTNVRCILGAVSGKILSPQTHSCVIYRAIKTGCQTKSCTGRSSIGCSSGNSTCPTCSNSQGSYPFQDDDETPEDGFEIVGFPPEPEPKNNDNRPNCFWCKGKTIKIDNGFSFYDYCKKCKK